VLQPTPTYLLKLLTNQAITSDGVASWSPQLTEGYLAEEDAFSRCTLESSQASAAASQCHSSSATLSTQRQAHSWELPWPRTHGIASACGRGDTVGHSQGALEATLDTPARSGGHARMGWQEHPAQGSDSGPRTDDLVGPGERGPHLRGGSRLLTSFVRSLDECAARDQEPALDALLIHGEGPVSAAALAAAASGPQRRLSAKPLRCRQPLRHCWCPPSPSPLVAARTCAEMPDMPGTSLTRQTRMPGPG
jgi:hypothetical protein